MNRRVRMVGRQLRCYRLIRAGPCENKAVRRVDAASRPSVLPNITEMRDKLTRNRRVGAGDVRLADVLRLSRCPLLPLVFSPYLTRTLWIRDNVSMYVYTDDIELNRQIVALNKYQHF